MIEKNMSPLFANAVGSIQMGVEDYSQNTPVRTLSAVRNFYAGVLLLGKEALIRAAPLADPDDIIGARYKPIPDGTGDVQHIPDGFQTIDFHTLGKRFKEFGIPIDTSELAELNKLRNAVEHRFADEPAHVVRDAIARAFPITVALFNQIKEHPADVLGDAWTVMLNVRALFEAERDRCRDTFAKINWVSGTVAHRLLRCTDCESELIEQRNSENSDQEQMSLVCRSCGAEPDWDDAIIAAVEHALSGESYERFKDTGETGPVYECPSCDRLAYIDFEDACAVCGDTFEYEAQCLRCYASIPFEDAVAGFDEGLCSYCTHIRDKDD